METAALRQPEENALTLKVLQNHLIKTIIGAFAATIIGACATGLFFYFKTNNSIDSLNDSKVETKQEITDLKTSVSQIKNSVAEINLSLSSTGIYTNTNKEQIKSLDERITNIEKGQNEMLKILYEIKARQR